ncbi:hypothetical protein LXA43DRAFT_898457 [Ganoderma leucocontextum]|nr:hypothetical protein LXA43DRAFT_898457 [Ganoderma leucocontextum]
MASGKRPRIGVVEGDPGATVNCALVKHTRAPRIIRGRRGGLKQMPHMPLDILVEIFGHMHPRDLLSLARTTKEFRAFLMSRTAGTFWKVARQQVEGLPECPEHLSEPAYANLVFSSHCYECLKPNVKNTLWEFGVRYCPSCKDKLIAHNCRDLDFIVEVGLQTSTPRRKSNRHLASCTLLIPSLGSRYKDNSYHVLEVAQVRDKWASLSTDGEKKAFIIERSAVVKKKREHALQMHEWQKSQERNRSHEMDLIREGRLAAIQKRLREEGWTEELSLMNDSERHGLSLHKAVRKSQKLTDYGWQSIRDELNEYMTNMRTQRLAREFSDMVYARLALLRQAVLAHEASRGRMTADMDWRPLFSDYALMPTFRDLMEASTITSSTIGVLLEARKAQIPVLEAQWREERKLEFIAMIRNGVESVPELALPEDTEDLLSLAITMFDCQNCTYRSIRWPQVLAHSCVRAVSFSSFYHPGHDRYRHAVARRCVPHTLPWPQEVAFDFNPILKETCAVIRACGKDPSTATFEAMEACEVRLLCRSCDGPSDRSLIDYRAFDWKNAVSGIVPSGFVSGNYANWVYLDAEHTARVLRLEAAKRDAATSPMTIFGCTKCRYRGVLDELQNHSRQAHDTENPQLGTDYSRHTDNPPYAFEPIKIYPEARCGAPGVVSNVHAGNGFVTAVSLLQSI